MYAVIDFETEAIQDGTGRAPRPVGVAIYYPADDRSRYYAWGHPTENNCDEETARRALAEAYHYQTIFHNCKFDLEVARQHLNLPYPAVFHDTMYLLYLDDPIAPTLSLKPSAERLLGMPPEERDAVREWLVSHRVVSPASKQWGAYISKAPGAIVGRYAEGDVKRTWLLFDMLYNRVRERGMERAYQREILLTPIIAEAEARGIRLDRERLEQEVFQYEVYFTQIDQQIYKMLGEEVNLDSGADLAKALLRGGLVEALPLTPTGRPSVARRGLNAALAGSSLAPLLSYRGALKTLLSTFMRPWLEMSKYDNRLHPSWNNVRGDKYGTRTGRLSCSHPNMQNVPTEFDNAEVPGYPTLPLMRQYILPEPGEVLVAADYNGQEMRLLAHFAEGRLAEIYNSDPRADIHGIAAEIVSRMANMDLKRKQTKIVGFSLVYGSGIPHLAEGLGVPYDEARRIKEAYFRAMPGLKEFLREVSNRSEVRTWGGRIIPVEPTRFVNGETWSFGYKLANHLIQGSAADQTKQSIIDYVDHRSHGSFLATVHDENVISVPVDKLAEEIALLRGSMEHLPGFDVPFVAEVETGPNWADLKAYND